MGLPLMPCTMPPVCASRASSVTASRRLRPCGSSGSTETICTAYSRVSVPETFERIVALPVWTCAAAAVGSGEASCGGAMVPKMPRSVLLRIVPRGLRPVTAPCSAPGVPTSPRVTDVTAAGRARPLRSGSRALLSQTPWPSAPNVPFSGS